MRAGYVGSEKKPMQAQDMDQARSKHRLNNDTVQPDHCCDGPPRALGAEQADCLLPERCDSTEPPCETVSPSSRLEAAAAPCQLARRRQSLSLHLSLCVSSSDGTDRGGEGERERDNGVAPCIELPRSGRLSRRMEALAETAPARSRLLLGLACLGWCWSVE
ncbi:hypothetical protein K431DRAFT_161626 [Polychaeton citri CBS 116435]|uniref:Uncharacterized protein n=1 Tax=Polychaeton citri CBS 116435 TaxID=1314669 RepID=A0A9P4ULA4_9PEZI|nr:hypothetical protein K431DRAFT_161626 [Polychaeton citri CBS 116435]